jgi:hypothetical protein
MNYKTEDLPKMIKQYEKKNKLQFYVNANKKNRREDPTLSYIQTVICCHFFAISSPIFRQSAIYFAIFFAKMRFTSPFFAPKRDFISPMSDSISPKSD